jgi:hypothetical protein
MVWAYYDESGEYESGKLINMSIGGCVSRLEKWQEFGLRWHATLDAEGLTAFHMTDFEAWAPPFNFKRGNGDRNKERHNRLLNQLLGLMLDHVEGFYGYGAVSKYQGHKVTHRNGMEDCIGGAVKDVVLRVWETYEEPINLVFGKQNHFPPEWVNKYVAFYDYGGAKGRVGSVSHAETLRVPQLQAADVLAYEIARWQRPDREERYPFKILATGAKERGIPFSVTWGPLRSKRMNLSGSGVSWG